MSVKQIDSNVIPFIFRAKTFEELLEHYCPEREKVKEDKPAPSNVIHHCGFKTDNENDKLIKDLVAKVNPNCQVIFPTDKYSPWDAKVVDQEGNVKLYIESKVRSSSSKFFHSMLIDAVKDKCKKLDAPLFVVQKFSDGAIYLYKMFENGELNPLAELDNRPCKKSQWDQSYKQKKVYLLFFMDCWKYEYRDGKLVLLQVPHKERAARAKEQEQAAA
ncbi:hypothetical protein H6F88_31795 [Oculatella sp. FACHB-28]|uniref:hypothetical protein n=1 Tax=Oculatella sp. FACHB-28 TaxID=2692845 RepID=UPI0016828547|nr:hypothetical protein [Oculatella sp. FACHB-28]MBD2060527.1 hypothetical protein [Oculatella sp. FACHB-28]